MPKQEFLPKDEGLMDTAHSFALPDVFSVQDQTGGVAIVLHDGARKPRRIMITLSTHAISFVLRGQKRLADGAQTTVLTAGAMMLYTQGAQLVVEDSPDYRSLMLFFSNDVLADFLNTQNITPTGDADGQRHRAFAQSALLGDMGQAMAELAGKHGAMSPQMRRLWCHQALRGLYDTHGDVGFSTLRSHQPVDGDTRISQVLEAHWQEGLNVDELAFLAAMSPSTFKRRVQALYGMSPKAWLDTRRMGYAWHLLAVSGRKPSEVAHLLGYANGSSFAQAFRRQFGVAPRDAAGSAVKPPADATETPEVLRV
ncbi:AraC family transcriptional regulator [Yoonia sp. BS5-3]|uniref:Helix-turn-helix transcriptional regulator n=1 Tax=Yoonia phaeophyticola TaxID=3137369 RepID=A0ABZ2V7M5_9RHOB